jgi:valyl-tRNA synthetase
MPYVTEEIWQRLVLVRPDSGGAPALIVAGFPTAEAARIDDAAERDFAALQDFVRGIRNVRAEKRVEAAKWGEAYVVAGDSAPAARAWAGGIETLARARPLHVVDRADEAPTEGVATAVLPVGRVVLPLGSMVDLAAERTRLAKQVGEVEAEVTRLEHKLGDPQFTSRAPAQVVAKEQERLATARGRLEGLRESLAEVAS